MNANRRLLRLGKVWIWVSEVVRPGELQAMLFWAGVIGFFGASASVSFRWAARALQRFFCFGVEAPNEIALFHALPWWACFLLPLLGGALAGGILFFAARFRNQSRADYMEAIVLGTGRLPFRASLLKSLSAMVSIASGASIGREGPMALLSAMLASGVGRLRGMPPVRLRLLVACGVSAGIAAAYNAPIAGALFVSEVILGSLAMESFGPLVFSSVISTLTVRQILGAAPLYEITVPAVRLGSNWEMPLYLALGMVAGCVAPLFLRSLRGSERLFSRLPLPGWGRMALGGGIVGGIAVFYPQVCGNGYAAVNEIVNLRFEGGSYLFWGVLTVLLLKVAATSASFGSGAAGGVFTPTLFVGAFVGHLFAGLTPFFWPGPPLAPNSFTLVGMGALLAAATHAPVMAVLMIFEMTLNYEIILPLLLACVVAHYVSRAFGERSIYAEALERKKSEGGWGELWGERWGELTRLRVADLLKPNPVCVREEAPLLEVVQSFIGNRFNHLAVVNARGGFLGVIALHDIKAYLNSDELALLVIARDLVRPLSPTITADASLAHALHLFSRMDDNRLPVVEPRAGAEAPRLIGSISKTDLLLALAEQSKK